MGYVGEDYYVYPFLLEKSSGMQFWEGKITNLIDSSEYPRQIRETFCNLEYEQECPYIYQFNSLSNWRQVLMAEQKDAILISFFISFILVAFPYYEKLALCLG